MFRLFVYYELDLGTEDIKRVKTKLEKWFQFLTKGF
jgi:hypothetical protein